MPLFAKAVEDGLGDEMTRDSRPAMPALFIGHGNPMNAIVDNEYTAAWRAIALQIPRPRAILCISAHWYGTGARVTIEERPRTIHDFGGFPRELFHVRYPAPGSPELANAVVALLAPTFVEPDDRWGLDHGTWSVLARMYPDADIPVVQLGIDETLSPREHYEMARRLQPLRREGVLVLGSGNVVHNLHAYGWGRKRLEPYDWAVRFETKLRALMDTGRFEQVPGYEGMGKDAALSAPTPDHFLPLLYVLAQHDGVEPVSYPVEGFDGGSVSMLCVRLGENS
jgi:4,5-DOPA dioxygenase extradiol